MAFIVGITVPVPAIELASSTQFLLSLVVRFHAPTVALPMLLILLEVKLPDATVPENTTLNLIGVVLTGSDCVTAWLIVTVNKD